MTCHELQEWRGWWIFGYWVNTKHTYGPEYKYYFDVPDDQAWVTIYIELWEIGILFDFIKVEKTYSYHLDTNVNNDKVQQGGSYVEFDVRTKRLSRVNTIVIYDGTNPAFFYDGHFTSINRYNLITLDVRNPSPTLHPRY